MKLNQFNSDRQFNETRINLLDKNVLNNIYIYKGYTHTHNICNFLYDKICVCICICIHISAKGTR